MHISVPTKELVTALEIASRVSVKHVTLPVLQCVLLQAGKAGVTVRATNLEIGIETAVPGVVTEEGVMAVPAAVLLQTVSLLHTKEVQLVVEGGVVTISGGGSETSINTLPHEEFPSIPKVTGAGQSIRAARFALGLKAVAFAASQSSIKPELGSILITQKKEHALTFVATDSFRLMEKTVSQNSVVLDESILIPYKNAVEIARVCELVDGDPLLRVNDNQCSLEFTSGVYITTRLTTGSFPDYVQIIPKEYASEVVVLKNDLMHAFKKTSIFLNKFFQVGLEISSGSLTVTAQSGDVGTTTESITAQVEGDEFGLNFNQRYVAEALSHFADDSVRLRFAGVGRPMVIEGISEKTNRYLVMPMNK